MTSSCYLLTLLCLVGTALAALLHGHNNNHHANTTPRPRTPEEEMHFKMDELDKLLESVARQLMLQQLYFNERIRNTYNSGVKQIRYTKVGPRPYESEAHSGPSVGATHDHPDRMRIVGLGELDAVLNGIDFRTRHNDYKLRMPADNRQFDAMQDVPLPGVPAAVSHLSDVHKQVAEMREWFSAWQTQNTTHRPYKDFFTPVLCYLEGFFMKDDQTLHEPATPDTHRFNALTQDEMEQKIRFSAYSGIQSSSEDFAYLPRYIMNVEDRKLDLARWTYRIGCHPVKDDLPLSQLHLQDDLSARIANNHTLGEYRQSPAARFDLSYFSKPKAHRYGLLDKLMQEIPGKENYGAVLHDDILGAKVYEDKYANNYTLINTAFYHRWYKVTDKGAMGVRDLHRGFADSNFFVAQTNQSSVAGMTLEDCHRRPHSKMIDCNVFTRRYSFAIPLEIIYLTPLHNWNPYHIKYKGEYDSDNGKSVTAHNRHGGMTASAAYDGSNSRNWYHTPVEFFNSGSLDHTDKTQRVVGVLDQKGTPRKLVASGIRTLLPEIGNLGRVRTRYPILPVHGEGLGEWKELDALKDMAMKIDTYSEFYEKAPMETVPPPGGAKPSIRFAMGKSDVAHGSHTHTITLKYDQMEAIGAGGSVAVHTSTNAGHSHSVTVFFHPGTSAFEIKSCDKHSDGCPDGHPAHLSIVPQ